MLVYQRIFLTINCVSQMDPPPVLLLKIAGPQTGLSPAGLRRLLMSPNCRRRWFVQKTWEVIQAAEIPWVFSMVFPLVFL
jgi:hypothetical protein